MVGIKRLEENMSFKPCDKIHQGPPGILFSGGKLEEKGDSTEGYEIFLSS